MKIGTRSILFGVHQFIVHPIVVWRAWKALFGLPTWKETLCIIIHDWGYWGAPEMEGEHGARHPELGAKIAGTLLGIQYHNLCLHHSRHYCKMLFGVEPSKLCWADKLSVKFEWEWFYMLRARLTGELREYRELSAANGLTPWSASDHEWFVDMRRWLVSAAYEQRASTRVTQEQAAS